MKVLKRNGQLQDFNLDKIRTTLACTSNDINQPLTESDLHQISNAIKEKIYSDFKDQISYVDVHDTLLVTLRDMDFENIAKAYDEFETSFVNK